MPWLPGHSGSQLEGDSAAGAGRQDPERVTSQAYRLSHLSKVNETSAVYFANKQACKWPEAQAMAGYVAAAPGRTAPTSAR